jgi:hypothetical protein
MANIEYIKPNRGRPISSGPTNPDKILCIIRLRDEQQLRFRVIGEMLEDLGYGRMTTQGSSQLYQKWKEWAYANKKIEAA